MKLQFTNIEGFSRYTIDNKGRVYDKLLKKFRHNRIATKKGNKPVVICDLISDNGKKSSIFIKNTVGKYFVKNPNNLKTLYNKDGNLLNCNAWNLVYLDLATINYLKGKKQVIPNGKKKDTNEKDNCVNFIQKLNKSNDEINLLKYYETENMNYLWNIFLDNKSKLVNWIKTKTEIKNNFEIDEILYKAFEYYVDRVKRFVVRQYQFKMLLICTEIQVKIYNSQTAKNVRIHYLDEYVKTA